MSFYVHMYGTQIGALNVYLEIGGNTTQLVSLTEGRITIRKSGALY